MFYATDVKITGFFFNFHPKFRRKMNMMGQDIFIFDYTWLLLEAVWLVLALCLFSK